MSNLFSDDEIARQMRKFAEYYPCDLFKDAASRIEQLGSEVARLRPAPSEHDNLASVVYRREPLTPADYDEAIEALQNAKLALTDGDSMGCRVCEDGGHGAGECHHNPLLLARKWAAATRLWQCWHCGFIATSDEEGRTHFGDNDSDLPSCVKAELTARAESAESRLAEVTEALRGCRDAIFADANKLSIVDTVWAPGHGNETLVDYIDSALAAALPTPATPPSREMGEEK